MSRYLPLLLICLGCQDAPVQSPPAMPDAGVAADVETVAPSTDGGTLPPLDGAIVPAPMRDASTPPVPAPEGCVADAVITLTTEAVTLKRWAQEPTAPVQIGFSVVGEACGQISARSDSPMVATALGGETLHVWLVEAALRSGRHPVQVNVGVADNAPLATVEVTLEILAAAPDEAPRHGLLVGIDGMRSDAFEVAHTPNMDRLANGGDWTVEATTQLEGPTLWPGVGLNLERRRREQTRGRRQWRRESRSSVPVLFAASADGNGYSNGRGTPVGTSLDDGGGRSPR